MNRGDSLSLAQSKAMSQQLISKSHPRRAFAGVALVLTTAALAVSLVVAATVVSIGIARATIIG
jgi:hypothetical protein